MTTTTGILRSASDSQRFRRLRAAAEALPRYRQIARRLPPIDAAGLDEALPRLERLLPPKSASLSRSRLAHG